MPRLTEAFVQINEAHPEAGVSILFFGSLTDRMNQSSQEKLISTTRIVQRGGDTNDDRQRALQEKLEIQMDRNE